MQYYQFQKLLPDANPILSPQIIAPEPTDIKLILKQSLQFSIPRKKFQLQIEQDEENKQIKQWNCKQTKGDKQYKSKKVEFDWHFQSGNMMNVIKLEQNVYRMNIRPDSNSNHQSLWFYFKVKGLTSAKFIISPFRKLTSLYNQGMKVCIRQQNGNWTRGGQEIFYTKQGDHYILKFNLNFQNPNKWTQISHCFPYTYSNLNELLDKKMKQVSGVRKQIVTLTMLKRNLFELIFKQAQMKPIILISARVHSGESMTSYVIKGLLEQLFAKDQDTLELLKNFEIRVLPMLNPDGVALGNYRCSFSGHDLNRRWKNTHSKSHTEIFRFKKQIYQIANRITMVIDIHGHSRKKGVFFYGCSTPSDMSAKQFPYLMNKCYPQTFSFFKSSFKVQPSKQGTLRIHLWKKLKIPRIYTMQCSFCGSQEKNNFLPTDFQRIGQQLLKGLIIYHSNQFNKQIPKIQQTRNEILSSFFKQKDQLINQEDDSGSDSEPSFGINEDFFQNQEIIFKKEKKISVENPKISRNDRKKFQSVVNDKYQYFQQNSKFKRTIKEIDRVGFQSQSPIKRSTHKDKRMSDKIHSQYRIRTDKHRAISVKPTIIKNQFGKQKNTISQRWSLLSDFIPVHKRRNHNHTEDIELNEQLKQMNKTKLSKQFFGAQYVRVKKQAQKMNKQKYNATKPKTDFAQQSDLKMQLQVRPLTSAQNIITMQVSRKK